jgi:hypothetical protein
MEYSVHFSIQGKDMWLVTFLSDPTGEHVEVHALGSIAKRDNFFFWEPQPEFPYGMDLSRPVVALQHTNMVSHLRWVATHQMTLLAAGKPVDPNDLLHPDLRAALSGGLVGQIIRHPLLVFFYNEGLMAEMNGIYLYKQEAKQTASILRRWTDYLAIHEKPFRARALAEIADQIKDDTEYWTVLSDIWRNIENNSEDRDLWRTLWASARKKRHATMLPFERRRLRELSDTVTIYRGVSHEERALGLSWTLDYSRALWFAKRFAPTTRYALVLTATVPKADVIVYFENEDEVVVLPENCLDVKRKVIFDERTEVVA